MKLPHPLVRRRTAATRLLQIAGLGLVAGGVVLARHPLNLAASNAEPTFAEDVAPILYKNCTTCHRQGGIGPFPLFEYDSAKANADEIREKVSLGQMPPWHAVGSRGVFRNDRRLSDADRNTIIRWIDAGTKPGNLDKLPARPVYPTTWSIGTPDAIATMPTEFAVPATGTIEYQNFEVPTGFTEDKWVQAFEVMPGVREVVHHVQIYAKWPPGPPPPPGTPPNKPAWQRNLAYEPPTKPKPRGFFDRFRPEPPSLGTLIGGMAPGTNAIELPKGRAIRMRAGTVLTFQMHYTAHGHAGHVLKDRSSVGFRFAKEPIEEEVYVSAFTNDTFTIPAGAKDVAIPGEITSREPVRIWGFLPHTHLRGTRWQYKMFKPDGTSDVILDIPNYDFNWQTYYLWSKPLEIPPGTKITSTAWYDNSKSNKHNPDPTKVVTAGPQTWDEMQYTGFLYSVIGRPVRK
jgi:hypothetical protein